MFIGTDLVEEDSESKEKSAIKPCFWWKFYGIMNGFSRIYVRSRYKTYSFD